MAGAVSQQEGQVCHAGSGAELRDLLRGNHRYVFTLIHKFQTPEILFDLLTRPGPDLAPVERDEVKKVARHLLGRVRGVLAHNVNWRGKVQARAQVREAIEVVLDGGLRVPTRRTCTRASVPWCSSTSSSTSERPQRSSRVRRPIAAGNIDASI
jgi:hypothetical protein